MTRRIVLVGGGYVTLHACARLRRLLRGEIRCGAVELVVISADDAHRFHGFTGEVLAGLLPVRRTRTPLVAACAGATVVHGTVVAVDHAGRTLSYRPADGGPPVELRYDHLVVGTGGREPVETVPGMAEFGHTLRGPRDIERFAALIDRLTDPTGAGGRVVVAGGGLAGVELAAAIADRGRGRLPVDLVQGGDRIVPALWATQPRLARRAERELDRLGVRVHCAVRVTEVSAAGAVLSDGTFLPATAVLGTIGQRPVPLPGLDRRYVDAAGRLLTSPDLSVADRLWSAGDAALVRHVVTGAPVAANALWAIKGGAQVGTNIARVVTGRPTRPFGYRGLGQAASFGLGRSIGELYGIPVTGAVAWLLRLVFLLRFHPSRGQAVLVLGDLLRAAAGRRLHRTSGTSGTGQALSGSGTAGSIAPEESPAAVGSAPDRDPVLA